VPVIALTASALKHDRQRCLEAGCREYLTKPIERGTLLTVVQRYLERPDAIHSSLLAEEPDLAELIDSYITEVREQLNELDRALDGPDHDELARLAHKLVGSGGTLGFETISDLSEELEAAARSGRTDICREQVRRLRETHRKICSGRSG
jgi:HPt (histidine-containing phosphotransfer) domain-containing protein